MRGEGCGLRRVLKPQTSCYMQQQSVAARRAEAPRL